ncbi:MAG: TetR/AcrR family transcriptional regulator [Chloroflexi bacterium]|nr:TetR/AcrR family transcriptional regulator [Chloroflexota bacterium]
MKLTNRPIRILAAASRLIAHYGFDKTTMDDIAREAGVSKGSLYLEWPGKEPLLHAVLNYEMQRLLADFQQRMQQDPQGGQIANLYRHALLALQANPLMCALYTRDSRVLGDFVRRQDGQRYASRILLTRDVVAQMQAAGLVRADLRPEAIAYLFSVIAVGFIHVGSILPADQQPPMEEIAGALSAVVQNGFAGPGGDSAAGKQAIQALDALVRRQYQKDEQA